MRLDFNVIWVDDQPARVEAQIKKIRSLMEEEGFNFKPTMCKSMDQVKSAIAEDIFRDEVDLILVDWDLGSDIRGQDVIEEIRRTIPYKDVIFYSAQTSPGDLRQFALGKNLE